MSRKPSLTHYDNLKPPYDRDAHENKIVDIAEYAALHNLTKRDRKTLASAVVLSYYNKHLFK